MLGFIKMPLVVVFIYVAVIAVVLLLLVHFVSSLLGFAPTVYSVRAEPYALSPFIVGHVLVNYKIPLVGNPDFENPNDWNYFVDEMLGIALEADETQHWTGNISRIRGEVENFMGTYGFNCYKVSITTKSGEKTIAEKGYEPEEAQTVYIPIPFSGLIPTIKVGVCDLSDTCLDCVDVTDPNLCTPAVENCFCGYKNCKPGQYCFKGYCYDNNPIEVGDCTKYGGLCIEKYSKAGERQCDHEVTIYPAKELCMEYELQEPVCCCINGVWNKEEERCVQ